MLENDMNKLITFLLVATFSVTGYCEKVKMNDLTERNGIYFKKSSKAPFTGELEGRYQGRIVDGKREGIWTTYSEKGNLLRKLHYKNGNLAFSEDYHENGNLKTRGYYENWEPAGLWESFDEDGKLINYATFH